MDRAPARSSLALAIAAAAVVGCGASSTVTPSPVATETASPTAPAATLAATPSPTPTLSTGAPQPTPGAPGALQAMDSYAVALVNGRYEDAWMLLGPGCQARWGSLAAFTKDRASRMKTAGSEYKLQINPKTLPLGSWLIGVSWAAQIDQPNSYLFSLKWAGFGSDPRGTEIWIASPTILGWRLYLAN